MPSFTVYHTEWATYDRDYQVADLPIEKIPSIAYAFVTVTERGEIKIMDPYATIEKRFTERGVAPLDTWQDDQPYYGNLNQLRKLKAKHPFRLVLSIGGWTGSKWFSAAVRHPTTLCGSLVAFLKQYPIFDGISFDWEFLTNDGTNNGCEGNLAQKGDADCFISFLKCLRKDLPAMHFSFCAPAVPSRIAFDVGALDSVLDEWHLMTYDFHDYSWGDRVCCYHTNLNPVPYAPLSVKEAVDAYLKAGATPNKIHIGAVTYSRGFSGTKGPGHKASGISPDTTWEKGIVDYKHLPLVGAEEHYDHKAGAAYSYDASRQVCNTYDTPESIMAKCEYIKSKGLGGCILWESAGDAKGSRSLVAALHRHLVE